MRRSLVFLLLFASAAALLHDAPALAAGRARALSTARFANVFIETESVIVRLGRGDAGPVVLRNSEGEEIMRREASSDATSVDFGRLPPGYFEAAAGESVLPLVVVIAPEKRVTGGTRLSVDTAMFILVARRQLGDMARLLRLCGFSWVRERLVWEDLEPEEKRFRWGALDVVIGALAQQGINVAESSESVPSWTRVDGEPEAAPDDLRHVYRFAQALFQRFGGRVRAWEMWNEPDISHFFQHPASEISALQKAVYLGFRHAALQRRAETPIVLGPSLAQRPAAFANHLLAEGTGHYLDVWHYHLYSDPSGYRGRADEHRELLERYGVASPLWVTEAGVRLKGPDGILTAEERARQAAFIGRSYAQALNAGIERPFWFIFPDYREKETGFGLFEPEQRAAFPGVAALSAATYALGRGDPLGRLITADPATSAFAFDRGDGTAAVVVWRDATASAESRLPLDWQDVLEIRTHLGTPLTAGQGPLQLRVGRAPLFLIVSRKALEGHLEPPPRHAPVRRQSPPGLFDIVVRLRSRTSIVDKRIDCYVVPASKKVALEAQIYNFGPAEFRGQLQLAVPAGWKAAALDAPVTVPPGGRSVVPVRLIPPDHYSRDKFTLIARAGNQESAPSVLWLHVDPRSVHAERTLDLGLDSAAVWQKNISGNGTMSAAAGPEGGVRFEMQFGKPGDNWAYPERRFEPVRDLSAYNALQFEYRTTIDIADVVRVVLGMPDGGNYTAPGLPASRTWQTATILFEDLFPFDDKAAPNSGPDLARIARLRIGINATSRTAVIEIRQIRAVRL